MKKESDFPEMHREMHWRRISPWVSQISIPRLSSALPTPNSTMGLLSGCKPAELPYNVLYTGTKTKHHIQL